MRLTQLAFLGLSLVACRGGGGDDGDDTPNPDGPVGGDVTIQEVQSDSMAVGTPVTLTGVVVTAIDKFGARTGDLWVQEPGGGEFSGIKVFGADFTALGEINPGDIITIDNGEKDEFALSEDMSGRTVTEIKGAGGGMVSVFKTGTGTVPTPTVVDAKAIEALPDEAARDAEWEKWEGVLINVTNARQVGDQFPFGEGPDQLSFGATGGLVVETVLAAFPADAVPGTCYEGITGIGDYFFDYLLLPRQTSDLVTGGTGCAAENVATVAEVQAGTATGAVVLEDVFVSAISFNKKNFWVSSSLTAGANEGLFVFRGTSQSLPQLPAEITVGSKVTVRGSVVENNNDTNGTTVTQLAGGASVVFEAAKTTDPVPVVNKTAAELTVENTGEPFESVLVTLTNVKVVTLGDQANFGVGSLKQGGTTFLSDDDIFRLPATEADKCYATITGVWTYQVFDNVYGFLPVAVGTGTGTCPP